MLSPDTRSPCLRNRQERRLAVLFFVVALIVVGASAWVLNLRGGDGLTEVTSPTVSHER